MALSKPLILEPLGLVLAPNKLAQYPDGAMLVDVGIVHTSAGSHETAPYFEERASITAPGVVVAAEIIPVDTGYILLLVKIAAGWRYAWVDTLNVASAWAAATHVYAPSGADFEIDGRVTWTIARDRVFVTTTTGPMVFDYLAPTTPEERAPRLAGMFAPAISAGVVTGADKSALKADQQAHIVAVVTRHFPDCYEVTGPPSAAVQVFAETDPANVEVTVIQRPAHVKYIPGDMIEVYRTYQTKRPINDGAPEDYNQGTSTTADYYLSSVFTIPDPDLATHTWEEATGDQNLGEALYTNQGVIGASAQKRPPPIARVIAQFREYTFYFDVTEPAVRIARVSAGVGQLTDAYSQEWGIGTRPGDVYDHIEIASTDVEFRNADSLAGFVVCNVDDLARVNPDTPGELTTPATGIAFRYDYAGFGDFAISASNGKNYQPPLPNLEDDPEIVARPRRESGFHWTESGQPEAIVAAGLAGEGTVYAAVGTTSALVIFCSDGIRVMSGTGGSSSAGFDWALELKDTQVLIRGPRACCRMGDLVFAATNLGAVVVDGSGMVREISTSALGLIGCATYSINDKTRVTADELTGDVYFSFDGDRYPYVYNTRWNKWSRVCVAASAVLSASGNLQSGLLFLEADADELIIRQKSTTLYQQSIARMQPVFNGDVSSLKRWSEVSFYFHASAVGAPVTIICNSMTGIERDIDPFEGDDVPTFIQAGIDANVQSDEEEFALGQVWMEVSRDCPAVCESLSLAYATPESPVKYVYYGCCIVVYDFTSTIRAKRGST